MPNYDVLYLAGELYNDIAQALSVSVSDENSLFPKEQLYNGRIDEPAEFGSNGADRTVTVDMNIAENGGFETSTLDGWTDASTGTGAIAEETSNVNTGSNALNCDGNSSGVGQAQRDYVVAAGKLYTIAVSLRGTAAASAVAKFRVYNVQTGNYLTSAGAWTATPTDLFTEATDTYDDESLEFTVESYATCQADKMSLRIICYCDDDGSAYFDDIALYPTINFLGVFGHNIAPVVSPQFRSSTDNFSAVDTLEATLTPLQPAFFGYLSTAVARRYWRIVLSGTNVAAPWLSAVIGYANTHSGSRAYGTGNIRGKEQSRNRTQSGQQFVTAVGGRAVPSARWDFKVPTESAAVETRDQIYERSGYGELPIVIVLRDSDTEQVVIHGRVESVFSYAHTLIDEWEHGMEIVGDPFPTRVS